MLETTVILALVIWFFFFGFNHAEMTAGLRRVILPWLYPRLSYVAQCPICAAFWTMGAVSLFYLGFTPLLFTVPVCTLFIDLIFNKLRDGCK